MKESSRHSRSPQARKAFLPALARMAMQLPRTLFPVSILAFDKTQARYWQALPVRRMAVVLLGLFCTFATWGFFVDLIDGARMREWGVLLNAALLGLYVAVAFVFIRRRRMKILPLLAVLVVVITLLPFWLPRIPHLSLPDQARHKIVFDAIGIMTGIVLGSQFFLRFMTTQGLEHIRAQTALELAHGIQQTLVPPIRFSTDAMEAYGISVPSEEVGGDLVDLMATGSGWLACVADVSGHGIPAGVLMGNLKTALRLGCAQDQPLAQVIEAVNRVLPAVKRPEMYATLACLLFRGGGEADYLLAGHPPILLYRAATAEIERCAMRQFPLGIAPQSGYECASVRYQPGDLFVLLSDGILETADSAGAEFGLEGVERALHEHAKLPLQEIAADLLAELDRFGPRSDDQTLLLVRALK
jgi:serine phosphatase RsbU (regulator of sigma subunit)